MMNEVRGSQKGETKGGIIWAASYKHQEKRLSKGTKKGEKAFKRRKGKKKKQRRGSLEKEVIRGGGYLRKPKPVLGKQSFRKGEKKVWEKKKHHWRR